MKTEMMLHLSAFWRLARAKASECMLVSSFCLFLMSTEHLSGANQRTEAAATLAAGLSVLTAQVLVKMVTVAAVEAVVPRPLDTPMMRRALMVRWLPKKKHQRLWTANLRIAELPSRYQPPPTRRPQVMCIIRTS